MSIENPHACTSKQEQIQVPSFEQALRSVCERYPQLAERIERSFETPQRGRYHNEGPKMDAHLKLVLNALHDVARDRFHDSVPVNMRERFRALVSNNENKVIDSKFIDYVFLHDIAKPDCLTLKFEGEYRGREITWDEWQQYGSDDAKTFKRRAIVSISYYHMSKGPAGQHGNKGADLLQRENVPEEIVNAVRKHEVAYQFAKVNPKTYKKHFVDTGFSERQQDFMLLASYIDMMGSLNEGGQPSTENFTYLIQSRHNLTLIEQFLRENAKKYTEQDRALLMKCDKPFQTVDDVGKVFKTVEHDYERLKSLLGEEVDIGHLTQEDVERVLSIVSANPQRLGALMKKKMRFIAPALKQSERR